MSEIESFTIHADWQAYLSHLRQAFTCFYVSKRFTDVTLLCDGSRFHCHRILLSAISPYLERILGQTENNSNPMVVLPPAVKYWHMVYILQYIYYGEFKLPKNRFTEIIAISRLLEIRGLCELPTDPALVSTLLDEPVCRESNELNQQQQSMQTLPNLRPIPTSTASRNENASVPLLDVSNLTSPTIPQFRLADTNTTRSSIDNSPNTSAEQELQLKKANVISSNIIRNAFQLPAKRKRKTGIELKKAAEAIVGGKTFQEVKAEMDINKMSLRSFMKRKGYEIPTTPKTVAMKRKKILV